MSIVTEIPFPPCTYFINQIPWPWDKTLKHARSRVIDLVHLKAEVRSSLCNTYISGSSILVDQNSVTSIRWNICIMFWLKYPRTKHTVHTIISLPNHQHCLKIHVSELMVMIRLNGYVLTIIEREIDQLKTPSYIYCTKDNWQNRINIEHTLDRIYLTSI